MSTAIGFDSNKPGPLGRSQHDMYGKEGAANNEKQRGQKRNESLNQ
jgi:hypothetical protein